MNLFAIRSLRWRLVAVMVLADLIVAITTGIVTYTSQNGSLKNQVVTRARGGALILAAGAAPIFSFPNTPAERKSLLNKLVSTLPHNVGIGGAAVYNASGCIKVLAPPGPLPRCAPTGRLQGTRELSNGDMQAFATIEGVTGPVGYASVTASSKSADSDLRKSTIASAAVRALGVLIFFLLSLAIAQYLLGPLENLARAAESVGSGDLSTRLPEANSTELASLAHTFNTMTSALEQRIKQLSFLASAGSTLPNTFRNGGDVRPIIAQFCEQIGAGGAGLVPRGEGDPEPLWYGTDGSRDPACLSLALKLAQDARSADAFVTEGRAIMVVPVLGNTVFVAVRDATQPFTREEQQVVINFAYQLGIAADNARLFESQQEALQVKDQFLSIVSHELRTPLTTIKGYSQMLRRKLGSDPVNERYAANIDAQVTRLTRLVDDLLDVTRFSRGQFELKFSPTDLRPMLEDVVTRFRIVAPRHTFNLELDDSPLTGEWDHDRLEQVLNNLLSNAVKYSPDAGTVTVRAMRRGDSVEVRVRDTGIGIDEENQRHLFERFYRAGGDANDIKGLGLGLYVTQRIVDAHHGHISVQSAVGEGSEFTVVLPSAPLSLETASTVQST